MEAFLTGGRIADLMVGIIVLEVLALTARRHHGLWPALPGLCAGLAMALALRCALTGAAWPWLALWLSISGMAHGLDVYQRWRH